MNDYYEYSDSLIPGSVAKAEEVSAEFQALQSAFDLVPKSREDGLGFAVNVFIPEATEDGQAATWGQLKGLEVSAQTAKTDAESANNNIQDVLLPDLTTKYDNFTNIYTNVEIWSAQGLAYRDQAQAWAESAEDTEVETGAYSAKHWAKKAEKLTSGARTYVGGWSAVGGALPIATPLSADKGKFWRITAAGTLPVIGAVAIEDELSINAALAYEVLPSAASVQSVNDRVGKVVLTKTDVGLSNVPDYSATDNLDDGSSTKFSTAKAERDLHTLVQGAQSTANSAVTNANAAQTTANTGIANAATASSQAGTAQAAAGAAQGTANTAISDAESAQSTANTAVTNAAAAQSTANTGVTNAAAAQSTANTANTTANTGVTNAATAQSAANSAQSTANSALTAAGSASSAASNAQTTANSGVSKGDAAQSTANTAVSNAATAQTTANTAVSNAATAQTSANTGISNAATAQTAANAAQSTANSKNKTYNQTATPTGMQTGDEWYSSSTRQKKRYSGSSWVTVGNNYTNTNELTDGANLGGTATWSGVSSKPAISALTGVATTGQIPNLDTSKITTGTMAVARLPALSSLSGSVTAGQVPSLDTSKITTGTMAVARLPAISALSGTPTDAQLGKIATLSGHVRAGKSHLLATTATPKFSITTNIAAGTQVSVGPTGSGATYIWTELDRLPSNASILKVKVGGSITTGVSSIYSHAVNLYGGIAVNIYDPQYTIFSLALKTVEGTVLSQTLWVELPLNANNTFKLQWNSVYAQSAELHFYYKGFLND